MKKVRWDEHDSVTTVSLVAVDAEALVAGIERVAAELPALNTSPDARERINRMREMLSRGIIVNSDVAWLLTLLRPLDRARCERLHSPLYLSMLKILFARFEAEHAMWGQPEESMMFAVNELFREGLTNPRFCWQPKGVGVLRRFVEYVRGAAERRQDPFLLRIADGVGSMVEMAAEFGPPF